MSTKRTPEEQAAYALGVVRRMDWAKMRREIDERIVGLSAVCSDKLQETDELKGMLARDIVLPCLGHLIAFNEAVKVEDLGDELVTRMAERKKLIAEIEEHDQRLEAAEREHAEAVEKISDRLDQIQSEIGVDRRG